MTRDEVHCSHLASTCAPEAPIKSRAPRSGGDPSGDSSSAGSAGKSKCCFFKVYVKDAFSSPSPSTPVHPSLTGYTVSKETADNSFWH